MNNQDPIIQSIIQLQKEIEQYNYQYYVLDQPSISDREFDELMAQLKTLEINFPQYADKNSPTQKVGGMTSSSFQTHPHLSPMLSLDNIYNEKDFFNWIEKLNKLKNKIDPDPIEFILEPKIDGVSLSLTYEKGILIKAATRGDGKNGEDVTENAKTIRSIPLKINTDKPYPELIECRGEIYLLKKDFETLNKNLLKKNQKLFSNPRNAAAGALRQKDAKITAQRPLKFIIHSIGYCSKNFQIQTQDEFIKLCQNLYLSTTQKYIKKFSNPEIALSYFEEFEKQRSKIPFEIDGLVIKVNSLNQQKEFGTTAKSPRWAVAYKFLAHQAESELQNIELSVGRTGTITPVAKIQPVECGGVIISSISIYNFDEINRLGVQLHDRILIERAGDVIPKIVRVIQHQPKSTTIHPPQFCPSCNEPIIKQKDEEVAYKCTNTLCPEQCEKSLLHFASRDGMNIEGLGEAIIKQLIQKKFVKNFSDLYRITKNELLQCELFADKKTENLLNQIQTSKQRPLSKLLNAFGIPHVGEKIALILAEKYQNINHLLNATTTDLEKIPELGPKITQSIRAFFSEPKNIQLINELKELNLNLNEPIKNIAKNAPLSEKTFILTGELETLTRKQAEEKIISLGGKISSTVTKKINFLVCGNNPGSKLNKAQKLDILILNEPKFLDLLNQKNNLFNEQK